MYSSWHLLFGATVVSAWCASSAEAAIQAVAETRRIDTFVSLGGVVDNPPPTLAMAPMFNSALTASTAAGGGTLSSTASQLSNVGSSELSGIGAVQVFLNAPGQPAIIQSESVFDVTFIITEQSSIELSALVSSFPSAGESSVALYADATELFRITSGSQTFVDTVDAGTYRLVGNAAVNWNFQGQAGGTFARFEMSLTATAVPGASTGVALLCGLGALSNRRRPRTLN